MEDLDISMTFKSKRPRLLNTTPRINTTWTDPITHVSISPNIKSKVLKLLREMLLRVAQRHQTKYHSGTPRDARNFSNHYKFADSEANSAENQHVQNAADVSITSALNEINTKRFLIFDPEVFPSASAILEYLAHELHRDKVIIKDIAASVHAPASPNSVSIVEDIFSYEVGSKVNKIHSIVVETISTTDIASVVNGTDIFSNKIGPLSKKDLVVELDLSFDDNPAQIIIENPDNSDDSQRVLVEDYHQRQIISRNIPIRNGAQTQVNLVDQYFELYDMPSQRSFVRAFGTTRFSNIPDQARYMEDIALSPKGIWDIGAVLYPVTTQEYITSNRHHRSNICGPATVLTTHKVSNKIWDEITKDFIVTMAVIDTLEDERSHPWILAPVIEKTLEKRVIPQDIASSTASKPDNLQFTSGLQPSNYSQYSYVAPPLERTIDGLCAQLEIRNEDELFNTAKGLIEGLSLSSKEKRDGDSSSSLSISASDSLRTNSMTSIFDNASPPLSLDTSAESVYSHLFPLASPSKAPSKIVRNSVPPDGQRYCRILPSKIPVPSRISTSSVSYPLTYIISTSSSSISSGNSPKPCSRDNRNNGTIEARTSRERHHNKCKACAERRQLLSSISSASRVTISRRGHSSSQK